MEKEIQKKLEILPKTSGIYKFFDKNKELLYVGKAVNLHQRVSSYFSGKVYDRPRIVSMIDKIEDIQTVQTSNEIEALVLEAALIKQYQPTYNSDKKDDKSYAYLYVTTKDAYPTVKIIRDISLKEINRGLIFGPYPSGKAIRRVFSYLRKMYPFCTENPLKPCFYSFIGLCPGPNVSKKEYRENINNIVNFLRGRKKGFLKSLEKQMSQYSKNMEYEKAAILRDKIDDLKYLGSKIDTSSNISEDEYIQSRKKTLIQEVNELSKEIGTEILNRIECYDISNISGTNAYGSMTVYENGEIQPSNFRIFKIKGLDTPNDPQMLLEVVLRRLKHIGKDTDMSLNSKPNLILLDGGLSQISLIKNHIPKDITLMGISKGKRLKRKGLKQNDEFWIVKGEIVFQIKPVHTKILINLRDEAHRFAILHHRKARAKKQTKSVLDEIRGVGPRTKKKLLKMFGSVEKIKKASEKDLYEVIKNKKTVDTLIKTLKI